MVFPKQFSNGLKDFSTINTSVKICVECGSLQTSFIGKKIVCKECGVTKDYENELGDLQFKPGEIVKIIDSSRKESCPYLIRKIKRSEDGHIEYLLNAESNPISLLYHESKDSHLEKIQ